MLSWTPYLLWNSLEHVQRMNMSKQGIHVQLARLFWLHGKHRFGGSPSLHGSLITTNKLLLHLVCSLQLMVPGNNYLSFYLWHIGDHGYLSVYIADPKNVNSYSVVSNRRINRCFTRAVATRLEVVRLTYSWCTRTRYIRAYEACAH